MLDKSLIVKRQPYQSPVEYPHCSLMSLSKARSAARSLADQVDHPVAKQVLLDVAQHITDAMVAIGQHEFERIQAEEAYAAPLKGI